MSDNPADDGNIRASCSVLCLSLDSVVGEAAVCVSRWWPVIGPNDDLTAKPRQLVRQHAAPRRTAHPSSARHRPLCGAPHRLADHVKRLRAGWRAHPAVPRRSVLAVAAAESLDSRRCGHVGFELRGNAKVIDWAQPAIIGLQLLKIWSTPTVSSAATQAQS